MRTEPATILVIFLGGVFFFFLLLPLAWVLGHLPRLYWYDRRTWLVLVGVVVLTGFFFALLIAGLLAVSRA